MINEIKRYVLVTVVYDNFRNAVPAEFIHSTVTCVTNSMILLRKTFTVDAQVVYNVPFDQLTGCRNFTVSATVENIQGNSTAVTQGFTVNGVVGMCPFCVIVCNCNLNPSGKDHRITPVCNIFHGI